MRGGWRMQGIPGGGGGGDSYIKFIIVACIAFIAVVLLARCTS